MWRSGTPCLQNATRILSIDGLNGMLRVRTARSWQTKRPAGSCLPSRFSHEFCISLDKVMTGLVPDGHIGPLGRVCAGTSAARLMALLIPLLTTVRCEQRTADGIANDLANSFTNGAS